MIKNPPAMQETQVPPLGREEPLEKGMATHSSILAGTDEPGRPQSMGLQKIRHDRASNTCTFTRVINVGQIVTQSQPSSNASGT